MKFIVLKIIVLLTLTEIAFARGILFPKVDNDNTSSLKTVQETESYQEEAIDYQPPALSGALNFQGRFALYQDPRASKGICMRPPSGSPEAVLKRNGIGYQIGNPSKAEITALAKGVSQVERLLGKPLPPSWRTNFNFINASGKWNQSTYAVNVRRPRGSAVGTSVSRMMHELGHKVGNSGAYQSYRAATNGKVCKITPYAKRGSKGTTRSNEEFSEVFAAYVAFPDLLAEQCPASYSFFANQLFPNSADVVAKCRGKSGLGNNNTSPVQNLKQKKSIQKQNSGVN